MDTTTNVVNASPTKSFFIDNFTRDLSLEDAILDFIDNSIDSYVRVQELDVSSNLLIGASSRAGITMGNINLVIENSYFEIKDNCGGIDINHAKNEVFRFGRVRTDSHSTLGVYGIGMKRGMFKIGKKISVDSKTLSNGFTVEIDVDQWLEDEDNWTFPILDKEAASDQTESGTSIRIQELHPHIISRIGDLTFLNKLKRMISVAYCLFLNKYINIYLNGILINPNDLPLTGSDKVTPARRLYNFDGVNAEIISGIAERNPEWNYDKAGWYILCNGRLIVDADKSDLTGWGSLLPQFHHKYRGFIGFVFFFSNDPFKLPWTTTKRGINIESVPFQNAKREMSLIGRPVVTFLNNMYASGDPIEEKAEKEIVDNLNLININTIRERPETEFRVIQEPRVRPTTISVVFKAEKSDVNRIKKNINKVNWSASQIGKYTFDYYLTTECPEL